MDTKKVSVQDSNLTNHLFYPNITTITAIIDVIAAMIPEAAAIFVILNICFAGVFGFNSSMPLLVIV